MKKKSKRRPAKKATRSSKKRGNRKKPYVSVAAICESVLREGKESKVASLIRIIDTYNIKSEHKTLPAGVLSFVLYVVLKSGEAIGKRRIRLIGTSPSGKESFSETREVQFNGAEHGVSFEYRIKLSVNETGIFWFDLYVNREMMTRIPLRINYSQQAEKG